MYQQKSIALCKGLVLKKEVAKLQAAISANEATEEQCERIESVIKEIKEHLRCLLLWKKQLQVP